MTAPVAPLRIAVLTICDALNDGASATHLLASQVTMNGHHLAGAAGVTDDDSAISGQVQAWIDHGLVDVVVTADCTEFSRGGFPPSIILVSATGGERYSAVECHPGLGMIGIVNLRTPIAAPEITA